MALDPTGYRQVIISQNDCLFKPVSVHDVRNAEWETLLGIRKTLINGLDGDRVQTRRSGVGQRDHPGHIVDAKRPYTYRSVPRRGRYRHRAHRQQQQGGQPNREPCHAAAGDDCRRLDILLDAFFPITPSPRHVTFQYRTAQGDQQLQVDASRVIACLHLAAPKASSR